MSGSNIRYFSYPRTEPPPEFADRLGAVFEEHELKVGTEHREDGLKSN